MTEVLQTVLSFGEENWSAPFRMELVLMRRTSPCRSAAMTCVAEDSTAFAASCIPTCKSCYERTLIYKNATTNDGLIGRVKRCARPDHHGVVVEPQIDKGGESKTSLRANLWNTGVTLLCCPSSCTSAASPATSWMHTVLESRGKHSQPDE